MNSSVIKYNHLINTACNICERFQKQIIKVALSSTLSYDVQISNLITSNEQELSEVEIYDLIGLYIKIIKWFTQCNKEEFMEKLVEMGFTNSFVEKFPLKYENRMQIQNNAYFYNNIESLKWRIDISLSNNILKKKVPPWIIISLALHKKQKHILIIDITTFHKLRFNVALMLKELSNLKNSSVLKK